MSTHGLDRFVVAQDKVWASVTAELAAGRKATHWMWFVFPQIAGLGRSETARYYALADLDEARAYLRHPLLGRRLREASTLMLRHRGQAPEAVLGKIDAAKLRSSMTLFGRAAPEDPLFREVLAAFYDVEDAATLTRLGC